MAICASCGARIVFIKTREGRTIPVNDTGKIRPAEIFDHKVHTSHFATCPKAADHRKRDRR